MEPGVSWLVYGEGAPCPSMPGWSSITPRKSLRPQRQPAGQWKGLQLPFSFTNLKALILMIWLDFKNHVSVLRLMKVKGEQCEFSTVQNNRRFLVPTVNKETHQRCRKLGP